MPHNFVNWPVVTNDDGSLTTGTPFSAEFSEGVRDSVADNLYSATNPTVKAKTIIDEVIAARGSTASLDARLDVTLNEDGTPKSVAGQASQSDIANILGYHNVVGNDDFLVWPDGDTSAPGYYVLAGAGGTIARCGTALADTTRKIGDFCAKLTRSGVDVTLTQTLLSASSFPRADFLKGKYLPFGCWVWSDTAGCAKISVADGVVVTDTTDHPGDSAWHFLTAVHPINAAATKLEIYPQIHGSNASAYFSGMCAIPVDGNYAITRWTPCPTTYGFLHFEFPGVIANGTDTRRTSFHRLGIIKDIQVALKTAGTTINFDVLTNASAVPAYESALSATLAMGTGKFGGTQSFHATYARRCLRGAFGTAPAARSLVSIDVSNVAASPADGAISIRVLVYARPLERFLQYNE